MDSVLIEFLKRIAEGKLQQTRCADPYMWNLVLEYLKEETRKNEEILKNEK